MKKYNIAVVGATGLVGTMMLQILKERKININHLYLFASEKSNGKIIYFKNKNYVVETLSEDNIKTKKIDYAIFSAGGAVSKNFAPVFNKYGAVVIDNSSYWRMTPDVPLVVPEVNFSDAVKTAKLISNPNCSTIQCMLPLHILNQLYKLKKVSYVTFQAVSGSGMKGLIDFERTKENQQPEFYPYAIYNNCIPQIGNFLDNGFTEEEIKMVNETKKILELPNLEVSATCVRVPIKNSHSISISAEFEKELDIKNIFKEFKNTNGLILIDDTKNCKYPYPLLATNTDEIYVGRIRKDLFNKHSLHFFVVADNIRKGAATNAIQILENLL